MNIKNVRLNLAKKLKIKNLKLSATLLKKPNILGNTVNANDASGLPV
jgi:hypothetical protein